MPKYCISGLTIEILAPNWVLHDNLKMFKSDEIYNDISCFVVFRKPDEMPIAKNKYIFDTEAISVCETEELHYVYRGHEEDVAREDCEDELPIQEKTFFLLSGKYHLSILSWG